MIAYLKILAQLLFAIPEVLKGLKSLLDYFHKKELEKKVNGAFDASKKDGNTSAIEDIVNK